MSAESDIIDYNKQYMQLLEFPKKYFEKTMAGKKAEFEVKLKEVFERTVPDFDDEFARGMGGYKSSKEMRQAIEKNLEDEKKQVNPEQDRKTNGR